MSHSTNYARLLLWAGQESAWLEALAIGLVQAKAYVPAQACRNRAAGIKEFVRSLGAEPELDPEVESETERLRRLGESASPYDPAGIARERAANRRQP